MMLPVFHPHAEEELLRAADFYEAQRAGLGPRFLRAIDETTRSIAEHPELGTKLTDTVRRRLVPRYPFGLLYETEPRLQVLAVMHQRRRPGYWRGRQSPPSP